MPDVPYFIPKLPSNHFGHSLPGLFLFCLPIGIVGLWVFHSFLKEPLSSLLPLSFQLRLQLNEFRFLPRKRFMQICLSLLIGAGTHIAWDSFTHNDGWAVQHWAALREQVSIADRTMPASDFLQHLSTVCGAALLAWYFLRWMRSGVPETNLGLCVPAKHNTELVILFIAGAVWPAAYIFLRTEPYSLSHGRTDLIALILILTTKILVLELTGYSVLWHLAKGKPHSVP
jgi:hypothetical protein